MRYPEATTYGLTCIGLSFKEMRVEQRWKRGGPIYTCRTLHARVKRESLCRKKSSLEVALRQSGNIAARKSLQRAAAAVAKKEGTSIGIVEVN
jgi:hypothetical protein